MNRHPKRTFIVVRSMNKVFKVEARDLRDALNKVAKVFIKRPYVDILTEIHPSNASASIQYAEGKHRYKVTVYDPERLPVFRRIGIWQ